MASDIGNKASGPYTRCLDQIVCSLPPIAVFPRAFCVHILPLVLEGGAEKGENEKWNDCFHIQQYVADDTTVSNLRPWSNVIFVHVFLMKKLKLEELARISVEEFKDSRKVPVCLLLDNIRSLHNVGSAFRTADAFRLEKIYLTGITGTPPHREIHKTALGATESVTWEYFEDPAPLIGSLKKANYQIIAIEQTTDSRPLQEFKPEKGISYCFVFGNEVNGVSDSVLSVADQALEIPQSGTKHSLNVSVCIGIVAWWVSMHSNR